MRTSLAFTFILTATSAGLIGLSALSGCSSDPLKYRVSDDIIGQLPADKLQAARKIKAEVDAAKQKWEIAKQKQRLVQLEFEAAQKYARASKLRLKAVGEKLALQNKGVPMDLPPGALEQARTDRELAKKNLQYRRLLAELHEKRVQQLFMKYHSLRADFFEKVVDVLHESGHESMKDNKKSDYVRQAAERKTLLAETLEDVERSQASIKSLKQTVEPEWAPRMSCKPSSQQPVQPPADSGTTTPPANSGTATPPAGSGTATPPADPGTTTPARRTPPADAPRDGASTDEDE